VIRPRSSVLLGQEMFASRNVTHFEIDDPRLVWTGVQRDAAELSMADVGAGSLEQSIEDGEVAA
jgi:hypothetical protein